jgi:chromosome segregation ATPase
MSSDFITKDTCKEKRVADIKQADIIRAQIKEHEGKLREFDIRFVELAGDVKHIKDRIDNGLSKTICQIKEKMDEFIPLVKESSEWSGKFKQAVYYVAVISFGGGLISLAFHFAAIIAGKVLK